MATEIKIPIPDQVTEEVRIVKWHKAEGDAVNKGEVVLEVETDKSVIEVEALGAGVILQRSCVEDDMVPVGEVVGMIGQAGEKVDTSSSKTVVAAKKVSEAIPQAEVHSNIKIKATPVAKKMAKKLGVDLGQVTGSGPNGRIVKEDVEAFAQGGLRIKASPNARRLAKELGVELAELRGSGPAGRIIGIDVRQYAESAPEAAAAAGQPEPGTSVAITKMRRAIGMVLQGSSRDTPHFNVTVSIDMSRAMKFRTEINEGRAKEKRISVNDLVLRACALALKYYPAANSRFEQDKISYLADINIGVATSVDTGLVVPALVNADKLSWDDMAVETKRLAQQARLGKILNAGKGTFTVSNLGMFGIDNFTAIINPPESAILAVGGIKDEVVAIEGNIGIRPMMKVTLCSDHRIIDGALAAEFLRWVKVYLEEEID